MRTKSLALMLALTLLLSACGGSAGTGSLSVCRIIAPDYQTSGQLTCSEQVTPLDGEEPLDTLLRTLGSQSTDTRAYNPLSGLEILDCALEGSTAVLTLPEAYLERTAIDRTLCAACCVLTLCALDDIDRVAIAVDGELVTPALSAADLSTDITGSETEGRQVVLYYADDSSLTFSPEFRALSVSGTARSERYVVEELLRAPEGCRSPLPQGTELLGVTRKGRSCTINLSSEFLENRPDTALGEYIAVYSLVNSLASLGGISEVLITVEGQSVDRYVNLSLANPLTPLSFVSAGSSAGGTLRQAQLYFAWDGALFGAPSITSGTGDGAQVLLDHLMSAGGFGPYESLFSQHDSLHHLGTVSGVCRVSVSRSFFERRPGDRGGLALDALALTLLSLEDVSSVLITYPDGQVPRLPGRDLSQPILRIDAGLIQ